MQYTQVDTLVVCSQSYELLLMKLGKRLETKYYACTCMSLRSKKLLTFFSVVHFVVVVVKGGGGGLIVLIVIVILIHLLFR